MIMEIIVWFYVFSKLFLGVRWYNKKKDLEKWDVFGGWVRVFLVYDLFILEKVFNIWK